jgi:glucose/arabinose dehydrogenase
MRKTSIAVAALAGSIVGCAAILKLLPERFAVNVPFDSVLGFGRDAPSDDAFGTRIRVPEGFSIGLYTDGVEGARLLRFTPTGDLLVSAPRSGRILLVERDADADGRADGVRVLLEDLNRPHGLDLRDGRLYVAETDAVGHVRFDPQARAVRGEFERIVTGLPGGGNHWSRTLRFGPDGLMYVSVGSSCNVCLEDQPERAALLRFQPDGGGKQIYATGLRNSVGFDWRPGTGELYATDNGRDLLGDDFPPCELNRVVEGGFYGWPFANGDRVADPDHGAGNPARIAASIPPAHGFRAHTAPLGITFIRGARVPPAYRGAALVALHGSWNRTGKDGYSVVSLHWDESGAISERPFATGFLLDEDVIGRPVDVAEGPDGAFYISDDYAGAIYRVAHGEPDAAASAPAARPAESGGADGAAELAALPDRELAEREARGAALFARHDCGSCHLPDAAPPGMVVRPLAGLSSRYGIDGMAGLLATPTPPMPVFPLSDEERRDLAIYVLRAYP